MSNLYCRNFYLCPPHNLNRILIYISLKLTTTKWEAESSLIISTLISSQLKETLVDFKFLKICSRFYIFFVKSLHNCFRMLLSKTGAYQIERPFQNSTLSLDACPDPALGWGKKVFTWTNALAYLSWKLLTKIQSHLWQYFSISIMLYPSFPVAILFSEPNRLDCKHKA